MNGFTKETPVQQPKKYERQYKVSIIGGPSFDIKMCPGDTLCVYAGTERITIWEVLLEASNVPAVSE